MAKINNSEVIQKLIDELQLYPGKDLIPSELADKILPVYNVNADETEVTITPKITNIVTSARVSGAGTVYAIPSGGQSFYLTAMLVQVNKAAGSAEVKVTGSIDAVTCNLFHSWIDATVYNMHEFISFNSPVKLDAGTNISTVPGGDYTVCIYGYLE